MKYLTSFIAIIIVLFVIVYGFQKVRVLADTTTLASDAFGRSVSDGWGTADTGGSYTTTGTASDFSVNGSEGVIVVTASASAGYKSAILSNVSEQDIDVIVRIKTNKVASGNSQMPYIIVRHISSGNEYRGRVRLTAGGLVQLQAAKVISGTETLLGTEVQQSGLTYSANGYTYVHMQIAGLSPATIKLRAWDNAGTEPGTWTYTVTDSTAALQAAGSIGVIAGVGSNTSNLPVTQSFDDLSATSAAYTISGTVFNDTNANGTQDIGESGYGGATLSLSSSNTATSAADGTYTFTGITAGTRNVTLTAPDGYKATTTDPVAVTLSSNNTTNFGIVAITSSTQPTAPYYSTFFYPWFRNETTDGAGTWGTWDDPDNLGTHSPTTNWFSNYLPRANDVTSFSPLDRIYSSNDYTTFKWQLTNMATAKQEVAISSWWGQSDATGINTTTNTILSDFMTRSDNPYPNLRFAAYYECEGNTCNGTTDPTVAQITSDLNYIGTNYASSPYYLRIDGKPVVFVYATGADTGSANTDCNDTTDTSMTHRWYQATHNANMNFYYVLKVFSGYATKPCQPSSWHQYGPAARTDSQGAYSYGISPGYWRSGDAALLTRDASAFDTAAQSMVASSATWRLTQTWNEWGEGSSVEPADQVVQINSSNAATLDVNGVTYGSAFITVLANRLPALENGTGAAVAATPTPTSAPSSSNSGSSGGAPDPNLPLGYSSIINFGPNHYGSAQVIADGENQASTYFQDGAVHDDVTVGIQKKSFNDLVSGLNPVPPPWKQGINTAGEIYKFSATAAFNGMTLPGFDKPVMITLPYQSEKIKGVNHKKLRIAYYNIKTKKWGFINRPMVINPVNHTVSTTVLFFSHFVVGYPSR